MLLQAEQLNKIDVKISKNDFVSAIFSFPNQKSCQKDNFVYRMNRIANWNIQYVCEFEM